MAITAGSSLGALALPQNLKRFDDVGVDAT
jgi:hypothetical protein